MATLQLTATTLTVSLTRVEKFFGLLRDVEVSLTAIRSIEAADDALEAARGLRAPGLGLPGVRKIGTWRRPGERSFVSVRRDQPAVRIELSGCRYDVLLVGVDDAATTAAAITAARSAAS
ncbi:hypothetical protein [Blastococcus sp. PRF04-17]|uniref:hypothetical protein n=1 Tax=Blastococcus sp. PRF04-17 TaxID=2933797 RepID=UPI001FF6E64C|nr:hypothetical protein [Blastococcus sp. PRF04-17]UOY01721.1 hypothetical protein MVA48_22840 [Blastococcus sp. PRF04-17]